MATWADSSGAEQREVAAQVRARIEQHVGEFAAAERQPEFRSGDAEFREYAPQGGVDRAGRNFAQEAGIVQFARRTAGTAGVDQHLGHQGHGERLLGAARTIVGRGCRSARDAPESRCPVAQSTRTGRGLG